MEDNYSSIIFRYVLLLVNTLMMIVIVLVLDVFGIDKLITFIVLFPMFRFSLKMVDIEVAGLLKLVNTILAIVTKT